MDEAALKAHYHSYLATINAVRDTVPSTGTGSKQLDLSSFVHDEVHHNGRRMTRSQYEGLILEAFVAIPNISFEADTVVANVASPGEGQLACRILFADCRPLDGKGTHLQGMVAGKDVLTFSEHVFYTFVDGKIADVKSLLDEKAFAAED